MVSAAGPLCLLAGFCYAPGGRDWGYAGAAELPVTAVAGWSAGSGGIAI